MTNELGLFARQAALHLEININTLRKWAIELEKQGYEFTRNDKDQRVYYERDIVVLDDFRRTIEKTKNLDNTAKLVVSRVQDKKDTEILLGVLKEDSDKIAFSKDELEELIQRTAQETAARTAEHLLQKFNDSIEQRDRQLMQGIRQTFEEKQEQQRLEIAAAQEEKEPWYVRLNPFAKKKEKVKDQM